MVLGSPSASLANKLVFSSVGSSPGDDAPTVEDISDNGESAGRGTHERISMYVKLFEEMLKEVIDGEAKLFVDEELDCFMKYHRLPYHAKYLFCRLCLRKTDKWHRLSALKYQSELGDSIPDAIDILCGRTFLTTEETDVKPSVEELDTSFPDLEPSLRLGDDPQVKAEPDVEPERPTELKAEVEEVKPQVKTEHMDSSNYPVIKEEDREIIDLTFDDDEEVPQAGPSQSPVYDPPPPPSQVSGAFKLPDYSVFADHEEKASLDELLDCLTTEELADIAKQLKIKYKQRRRDTLIASIRHSSATQSTLPYAVIGQRKGKEKVMLQSKLPFGSKGKPLKQTVLPFKPCVEPKRTQQDRVYEMVTQTLGKCVRLNSHVLKLFRRANLIYFRVTQHTSDLLTPAILARAKKREYADYPFARTPNIWPTRADLLAYEDALEREAEVDALLENTGQGAWGRGRSTTSRTPGPGITKTPVTPRKAKSVAAESPANVRGVRQGTTDEEESVRVQNAREVKRILWGDVYPKWQALINAKAETDGDDGRRKALQRFECGHVLTRVVCKGAYALGILHEYEDELAVLDALLAQTRWRRGRRGRWHERRALLLMKHLRDAADTKEDKRAVEMLALEGVVAALEDPDTHIVCRPMLERRLTRLEKWLNVPAEQKHECVGQLKKAKEVYVEGVRLDKRLQLDQAGRIVKHSESNGANSSDGRKPLTLVWRPGASPRKRPEKPKPEKSTGKSVWKGREGEEVSVEELALQAYEDIQGCRGFHSEGRVVTTLFGLLFWDVIFAPIPGAFETEYQAAPLDLAEDTFYYARQDLADARLAAIESGHAVEIITEVYEKHKDVMCVGVRWDLCAKEDLVGIAQGLGSKALAVICRLMCEDYAGRTGGVPDLIVWNEEEGWAKFVEVKGPGDSLQENQKVWIDVLLQAGTEVEVCHVCEKGNPPPKKAQALAKGKEVGKTPRKRNVGAGAKRKRAVPDSDSDVGRLLESEDEENTDYSQLDRHTEDGEDESPVKKKRRKNASAATGVDEPESPVAKKVARLNSQPEILNQPSRTVLPAS